MSKARFISDLKGLCKEHGVSLFLVNGKHIDHKGERYGGWFDPDTLELFCAYRRHSIIQLEILVHESCHLDQHIEKRPMWQAAIKYDAWNKWGRWMSGEEFKPFQVKRFMRLIQLAEMECEQMSVEKIKKYRLPIDIRRYRAKANSYLLFYTLMLDTRKWVDDKGPYKFPSIVREMPSDRIISDFSMSEDLKKLYISKVYKK